MKKKYYNLLYIIIITFTLFLCFLNYNKFSYITIEISYIFLKNVFSYLFFTMVLNNILLEINFPYFINKIFKNKYIYILIMSLLCGSPTNAIIINDYLDKNIITNKSASIILSLTIFNNPLFIYNYLNKISNNYYLLLFIYLPSIIIFLLYTYTLKDKDLNIKYKEFKLSCVITNSIKKSINNMLNIFAIIIFFKLLCSLIFTYFSPLSVLLSGFIEITNGLNELIKLNIQTKIKELLFLVILNFNGLSIHLQLNSILINKDINYKYLYIFRFLFILLSLIIIFK